MKKIFFTISVFFFFICTYLNLAQADSVLDTLIGESSTIREKNLSVRSANKKVEELDAKIKEIKKKNREGQVEQKLKEIKALIARYSSLPKKRYLRKSKQIRTQHKKIVEKLKTHIALFTRLQDSHTSYEESIEVLKKTYKDFIEAKKNLTKLLLKKFPIENRDKLGKVIKRVEKKLKDTKADKVKTLNLLKEINKNFEKNKKQLLEARNELFKKKPKKPSKVKVVPKPKQTAPPTKGKRGRKRRRYRRRRKVKKVVPTPAQLRKQREKKDIELQVETLQTKLKRLVFDYYRYSLSLIKERRKDEQLHLELSEVLIELYQHSLNEMKSLHKRYASQAKGGIFHKEPFVFNSSVYKQLNAHSKEVFTILPKKNLDFWYKLLDLMEKTYKSQGVALFIFQLILPFLAFLLVTTFRRLLRQTIEFFEKKEKEEEKKEKSVLTLWKTLTLVTTFTRQSLYPLGFSFLLIYWRYFFDAPFAWLYYPLWAFFTMWILLMIWATSEAVFGVESPGLFVFLSDQNSKRFRRYTRIWGLITATYMLFGWFLYDLDFAREFTSQVHLFYISTSMFLAIFAFTFRYKGDLAESHEDIDDESIGQAKLWERVVAFTLFLFFVIYIVYATGYRNLSMYLTKSIFMTFGMLLIGSVCTQAGFVIIQWLVGNTKKRGKFVIRKKRQRRFVSRFIRGIWGAIIFVVVFALLFEVWEVPGGARAILKVLDYPIFTVQKSQVSFLSIVKFMLTFATAIWISKLVTGFLKSKVYTQLHLSSGVSHAINTVVSYLTVVLGILVGLQVMGLSVGVLAVFAGVVGIGVGFGSQNIANNFISGLIITFGRPISIGDAIEVNGIFGIVREISPRSTTIETLDKRMILVPNSEIITKQVVNSTLGTPFVIGDLVVGVAYGSDTKVVKEELEKVAAKHPRVLRSPAPHVRFIDFGASSLDFMLRVGLADPADKEQLLSELRFEIDEAFAKANIEIPFPQRDLHLDANVEDAVLSISEALSSERQGEPESPKEEFESSEEDEDFQDDGEKEDKTT